jgi:hypothetical protein
MRLNWNDCWSTITRDDKTTKEEAMMMVLIRSHDCHYGFFFFFVFFIFCVNSFPPHTWHNHTLFIHEGNAIYNMDWMSPIRQKDKKKINKDSKKGELVFSV